jgi:hypothetical protein
MQGLEVLTADKNPLSNPFRYNDIPKIQMPTKTSNKPMMIPAYVISSSMLREFI